MTRTELIAALEAAEGPSRTLDSRVWCQNEGTKFQEISGERVLFLVEGVGHVVWMSLKHVPHYTESIDAALSFTPEGVQWGLTFYRGGLIREEPKNWFHADVDHSTQIGVLYEGKSYATPAIALCIANLRALEAQEEA